MIRRFFPNGYPIVLESDAEVVLQEAEALWGDWPQLVEAQDARFGVEIAPVDLRGDPPEYSLLGGTLSLTSSAGAATFSTRLHSGWARIAAGALADAGWFAHHWLQAWVLTALDMAYFDPLHAACVARDGRGMLLCGDSGSGKSTLAYACVRSGWDLVSDDGVRLAGDHLNANQWIGARDIFHLRPAAREVFPELGVLKAVSTFAGKEALLVTPERSARHATPGPIVFLERRSGPCNLSQFPHEEALTYFLATARNPDRAASEQNLRRMIKSGCVLLQYEDAREAAATLETLL